MTQEAQDDPIDALLREQFEGPVPDAGFSALVMQRIPRTRRRDWPTWIGLLAGAAGCFASLLLWPALHVEHWHSAGGHWSSSAIALAGATAGLLLTGWWSVTEPDDH